MSKRRTEKMMDIVTMTRPQEAAVVILGKRACDMKVNDDGKHIHTNSDHSRTRKQRCIAYLSRNITEIVKRNDEQSEKYLQNDYFEPSKRLYNDAIRLHYNYLTSFCVTVALQHDYPWVLVKKSQTCAVQG
eukprot:38014_1